MGVDLPSRPWRAEGACCNLSIGMVRSEQSGHRESELGKGLEISFEAGEMNPRRMVSNGRCRLWA